MSRTKKFPAARAVLELVATVVDEAGAKQITLANTNDPEALALIESAVERVEKAQAERAIQAPPVLPQWGERVLTENERNSITALINFQAENTGLSPYAVETSVLRFFDVETIRELKAWEYDGVIRYLVDFRKDAQ
jgi:hypothetical protein